MKSLLLLALGLARTVILGVRIEAERIVVAVRPHKKAQRRCPVCGRACEFYDMANRGAPRLWRAMDLARSPCWLEYAPCRVRCPEHGVRTEAVPWARHNSRFTRDFEDWVACLAVRCTVSELARVEWHSVLVSSLKSGFIRLFVAVCEQTLLGCGWRTRLLSRTQSVRQQRPTPPSRLFQEGGDGLRAFCATILEMR